MWMLDAIAEQRIREAMERGEFDNLPGAGKPLQLDDDTCVPEHLRVAYRILKNAGFIPPEIETRRQIHGIMELLRTVEGEERSRALRRLHLLRLRAAELRRGGVDLQVEAAYFEKLLERLS